MTIAVTTIIATSGAGTASDFITSVAAQTISGTLSSALSTGQYVEVSYDGGASWSHATSYAVGSTAWSTDTTLSGSGTFEVRCHIHPKMKLRVAVQ